MIINHILLIFVTNIDERCTLLNNFAFQESLPFAVIGSNTFIVKEGNRVIGRQYPWGVVEGTNLI